jgi:diguanylate cyclase (GGDEF)-like protein
VAHITDSVTGLFNTDYMAIKLAEEFKRTRRFADPLTMIMLGLRRGDEAVENEVDADWRRILNEVAGLLLCESRDIDILAREDASTFCLLLPHTPAAGARSMADRILASIASRSMTVADGEAVQASAGMVEYIGQDLETAEEIRSHALDSLRLSTRSGGGSVVAWNPSDA